MVTSKPDPERVLARVWRASLITMLASFALAVPLAYTQMVVLLVVLAACACVVGTLAGIALVGLDLWRWRLCRRRAR